MAPTPKQGDFDAVRQAIRDILEQEDYDDGSAGPVLVRLAWHASGTYDQESRTGGSNGAGMRYEKEGGDPANAGLQHARVFLEPIKEAFPWISYADLWTLAGVEAIHAMGGPVIAWKPGRTDFVDDSELPPRGRLPDGSKAADHLREIFYRMGFSDQEIVALSGAHNLGRCHEDRSGFEGAWVMNPTRFSNTYFKMLKQLEWKPRRWTGPFQYHNDSLGAELMMLPTDMALVEDQSFRQWVDIYADDKDRFFDDFSAVFAKLVELGVDRDETDYEAAPKKSDEAGAPDSVGDGMARGLKKDNDRHREQQHGGMHLKSKL